MSGKRTRYVRCKRCDIILSDAEIIKYGDHCAECEVEIKDNGRMKFDAPVEIVRTTFNVEWVRVDKDNLFGKRPGR